MQKMIVLLACVLISFSSFAKIWRVNNNAGVIADFTDLPAAVASASVVAGDTVHVEPSAALYTAFTLSKRLVFVGAGYFLNPADATFPGNAGLQFSTTSSTVGNGSIFLNDIGAAGSKFLGLSFANYVVLYANATAWNTTFEKDYFGNSSGILFYKPSTVANINGVTVRKCFFYNTGLGIYGGAPTLSNLTLENSMFYGNSSFNDLSILIGSANLVRNNNWFGATNPGVGISNAYVANNIFSYSSQITFTSCTIKNNLFASAQTLPGTATGNQVSVNMTNVYVGGTTGSLDSRAALKAGSPAIGAGVTIAGYTPDAGAFGSTDPYKLSGIPPVPSIYSLSVPTSIPTGTATMSVTFSSRNNN